MQNGRTANVAMVKANTMAKYEVTCELVVRRTVWVNAKHGVEAEILARQEISKSMGVETKEVFVINAKRETSHPYQFNFWKENDERT